MYMYIYICTPSDLFVLMELQVYHMYPLLSWKVAFLLAETSKKDSRSNNIQGLERVLVTACKQRCSDIPYSVRYTSPFSLKRRRHPAARVIMPAGRGCGVILAVSRL